MEMFSFKWKFIYIHTLLLRDLNNLERNKPFAEFLPFAVRKSRNITLPRQMDNKNNIYSPSVELNILNGS